MGWDLKYRRLKEGETILATDHVQVKDGWRLAEFAIGQPAPDPMYTSHRVYRRKIEFTEEQRQAVIQEVLDYLKGIQDFFCGCDPVHCQCYHYTEAYQHIVDQIEDLQKK